MLQPHEDLHRAVRGHPQVRVRVRALESHPQIRGRGLALRVGI